MCMISVDGHFRNLHLYRPKQHMFLEKTWYISCGFTGFVLSLQVPKAHGKHQGLPENCWYLLVAEPFYSQDSCEGPKRYPHKSWRRWSCQCHRRCKSEHMPTPCYLAGEEPTVSIFRKPYREYLRIGCLEFRNHYSNLIIILFVCQGYRYSGNIERQELWPTVANKLNWFAAKRKFRQQNHIQKHIFLEDRCVYMSNLENPRFTERTSTNLGRSHRLPHVCTIMIYGQLGGIACKKLLHFLNV